MRVKAPVGLKAPGRRAWLAVTEVYELTVGELLVMEKYARTLDDVARVEAALIGEPLTTTGSTGQLRAHPLLAELRGMRALAASLLRMLDLPQEQEDGVVRSATSERKRAAAMVRWRGNRRSDRLGA